MESKLDLFLPESPNYLADFAVRACFYLNLFQYDAELIIDYVRELPEGNHGMCHGDSERVELSIAYRSDDVSLTREEKMLALAHELVHAQQYLSGRLKDCDTDPENYTVVWNRDKIHWRDDLPVEDQPWETEAYGREREIYEACID